MKHRTVTLVPFPVTLTLVLGTETEFKRHMLKNHEYVPEIELDPEGGAFTDLGHHLVIWISSHATPTGRLTTLVHETSHVLDAVLKYVNAGSDEGAGETRAYLSGHIFSVGLNLVVPAIPSK